MNRILTLKYVAMTIFVYLIGIHLIFRSSYKKKSINPNSMIIVIMMRTIFVSFSMHAKSEAINNAHNQTTYNTHAMQVLPKKRNVHRAPIRIWKVGVLCEKRNEQSEEEKKQQTTMLHWNIGRFWFHSHAPCHIIHSTYAHNDKQQWMQKPIDSKRTERITFKRKK